MRFHKYHALGNDYLVYADTTPFPFDDAAVVRICDRHRGLGSDGILVPDGHSDDAFGLRILNPDGSLAERSGNGLRIFSRYLWDQALVGDVPFRIVTVAGPVVSQVFDQGREVEVDMGHAEFASARIPVQVATPEALDLPVELEGQAFRLNAVSMGNPHCVVFVEHTSAELAKTFGPLLERHPLFPNRSNVQFVEVLGRNDLRVEIWERGAGYTLASGTSSCAAAAMARRKGYCDGEVRVHLAGGQLRIRVEDDFRVHMRGAVQRIGEMRLHAECLR